jgi:DNA/RNA-binding domain of Phe-tRNA-synthetase-like protein
VSHELELHGHAGFVEPSLAAEHPGLRLEWVAIDARVRPSSREAKRRLRALSDRYRGANVIAMRTQPIAHAYRAFFRQIGLDPDASRIPSEEAAVSRLVDGGFYSHDTVQDALLIALMETGVPVWALNAELIGAGGLGIRVTARGDRFGDTEHHLPPGRLVVADDRAVHAILFGDLAPGHGVDFRTRRIALFTIGVAGVPAVHLDEALWLCIEALREA